MKKILSLVIALAILISMFASMSITVSAESTYENNFNSAIVTDGKILEGETERFTDVELVEKGSNKYIKGTSSNALYFKSAQIYDGSGIAVLDFDVNIGSSENFVVLIVHASKNQQVLSFNNTDGLVTGSASDTYVDDAVTKLMDASEVTQGWHNVKVIMDYHSTASKRHYSIMFDNKLLVNKLFLNQKPHTSKGIKITTLSGIDNLKFTYDTDMDIPCNLTISGTTIVGETLVASASTWENDNHAIDTLEYKYVSSGTVNGTYDDLSSGADYTLQASDEGNYIKAAVRVNENNTAYSDWIYTEPQLVTAKAVTPFKWTDTKEIIYAPTRAGDVYKYLYTHNNGGGDDKAWEFTGDTTGMTVESDGDGNYVLTVTDKATAGNVQLISNADTDKPVNITVKKAAVYDFENSSYEGFTQGTNIKTEGDGNKYLDFDSTKDNGAKYTYSRFIFDGDYSDLTGTVAIDFDILNTAYASATLYFDKGATLPEISLNKLANYPAFKDTSMAADHITASDGWNHVRIFLDLDKKVYSMFINDIALSINNEIPGFDEGEPAKLKRIQFWASIDNFTFANVTPMDPKAYNAKLGNIAAGVENFADYDFYLGSAEDKCSTVEWLVTNDAGEFEKQTSNENNSFTPDADMIGKYVKAVITPSSEIFGDTVVGSSAETKPTLITDVKIGELSLLVNDVSCNIKKSNIEYKEKAEEAPKVTITVPAKFTNGTGKKVIFALAQYDASGNMAALSSETKELTSTEQYITLEISALKFDDSSKIKLIILDESDLTPLNSVTFLR